MNERASDPAHDSGGAGLHSLLDALRTPDFEEYGHAELVGAEWSQETLVLRVDVRMGDDGAPERWSLRCLHPRAHALAFGGVEGIQSRREHPLLWEYTEPAAELSFHGRPENIATVLGELWQTHASMVEGSLPFLCRTESLAGGFGVLATGPACLLRAYEAVLARHGLKPSLLSREPKRWNGSAWVPEERGLSVLLLDGSHVVAVSIEATRLDVPEAAGPSDRLIAEILAEGLALGLYDRSDIAAWALGVVEREATPSIAVIELAMGSRLDDSATAELLRSIPGPLAPEAVLRALVGVVATAVVSGSFDARSAARLFYTLCDDAPGELHELTRFEDEFSLAEDGSYGVPEQVASAFRERLGALEHLAAGAPIPTRYAPGG